MVVGGGAVGLAIAEALTSRGAEAVVVERASCGGGASAGNAGWITPSLAIPVPGPGVIGESLRWLVNPSGPLWIRPSLSPAMLEWIARFVRGCSRSAYQRGLVALQGAGALAGPAFDRLAERGVEFELHDEPLLYPAFERPEFEHLLRVADELAQVGGHAPRRLSAGETVSLEPALGEGVVGGLVADGDRRVRPESLTAGLQRALEARGVSVRQGESVTASPATDGRWLVQTSNGSLAASAVVLAAGVDTVRLLAPLGLRLPIVAAKGYSRTYRPDPSGPRRALYLEGPKVAVSAFDGGVRVSGTLELGAQGLALSSRRLGGDHSRGAAGDARLADAGRPPGLGRHALAVTRRPAVDRSPAGTPRLARRHRARHARDHVGAGHRRAHGGIAARRHSGSAARGVRSRAVCTRENDGGRMTTGGEQ